MSVFDRLKSKFGAGEQEAVSDVVQNDEILIPATRAYIRGARNWQRKRGAGWTRPYRKGRTQRV